MDGQKQYSEGGWPVPERADLQLQRRQAEVRHERHRQPERELWFRLGCRSAELILVYPILESFDLFLLILEFKNFQGYPQYIVGSPDFFLH